MSNSVELDHPAVLLPGPVELDDAVLGAMGHHSESHLGPDFASVFGGCLSMLRKLFQAADPAAQPFILSGSGTLGWDVVAANLTEPGDDVLVLETGHFATRFADCLRAYGAVPSVVGAPVGSRPSPAQVEAALEERSFNMVVVVHVDTSTGVLNDLQSLCRLVREKKPDALVVVDGVCSVACEEVAFDDWGIDALVTASQKGIGCPAGLCLSMFSGRAMERLGSRRSPVPSYFANLKNWVPVMENYEAGKPSYFATPSSQLVRALHTSLGQITAKPLARRFARHKHVSDQVKAAVHALGLRQVAATPAEQAHSMTAVFLPDPVKATDLLPLLAGSGLVLAGPLHPEIAPAYIRIGHMGVSVMDPDRTEITEAMKVLASSFQKLGYSPLENAK